MLRNYPDGGISRLRLYSEVPIEIKESLNKSTYQFTMIKESNDIHISTRNVIKSMVYRYDAVEIPDTMVDNPKRYYRRRNSIISKPTIDLKKIPSPEKGKITIEEWRTDLIGKSSGSTVVKASDEHYGPASNVIDDEPPTGMHDGFESKRSRLDGHIDWVIIQMGNHLIKGNK